MSAGDSTFDGFTYWESCTEKTTNDGIRCQGRGCDHRVGIDDIIQQGDLRGALGGHQRSSQTILANDTHKNPTYTPTHQQTGR